MSIPDETARAWVDIDLPALIANARTVAAISGAGLLPMVKGNAYGLGALACARALEALDPWGFGVATAVEGAALRSAGIRRPILVFSPFTPESLPHFQSHQLRPAICDHQGLDAWLAHGDAPFHVEVDTGMSRTGFRWNDTSGWKDRLHSASGCEGIFTHFHSAERDTASLQLQWQRLLDVVNGFPKRPALVHAANSAAALRGSTYAGDLVRPGIFLYGGGANGPEPSPVARLRARVVATRVVRAGESVSYDATWTAPRDTFVATLGIGYADGIPRALSNTGAVDLGGSIAPIVGRVTMDFTMVAPVNQCEVGAVATVYGGLVSLDEQAHRAGTISYELLASIGARVERRYDRGTGSL